MLLELSYAFPQLFSSNSLKISFFQKNWMQIGSRLVPCLKTIYSGQVRFFFSRHVFEPRLIVAGPESNGIFTINPLNRFPEGSNDRRKPVVLLLGWAGAKQSHLEKYAAIYHREGYQTVCFTPPCYHYRIPNSRYGFYMSPLFRGLDAGRFGDFRDFKHK